MMRRKMGLLAVVVLVGFGCGGRTIGGGGNNNGNSDPGQDGSVYPDAGIVPDGGTGPCVVELYQWLRPWRLESLYVLENTPLSEGQTIRIAAGMTFGGCQRLAQVDYEVDSQSQTIRLMGFLWEELGPNIACPDVEMYGEEILSFSDLSAGDWRVYEATSGVQGLSLDFHVNLCGGAIDCFCNTYDPPGGWIGADCQFNCDCDPSLECLPHYGMGGPFSMCGRSCSVDADCHGWEWCAFTDDGAWGVCEELMGVNQCPAEGCAPGFDCVTDPNGSAYCEATFSTWEEGGACDCDEQCPVGLRCVDFGADAFPACHAPCRGDRDCPGGMCGDYLPDTPPICITMWM